MQTVVAHSEVLFQEYIMRQVLALLDVAKPEVVLLAVGDNILEVDMLLKQTIRMREQNKRYMLVVAALFILVVFLIITFFSIDDAMAKETVTITSPTSNTCKISWNKNTETVPATRFYNVYANGELISSSQDTSIIYKSDEIGEWQRISFFVKSGNYAGLSPASDTIVTYLSNVYRLYGDVNNDSLVDVDDYASIRSFAGSSKGTANYYGKNDLNCDGVVDVLDAVMIQKYLGGRL